MLISLGASTNIKDRKGRTPGDFKTYFDTKGLFKRGNTTHPSINMFSSFIASFFPSSSLWSGERATGNCSGVNRTQIHQNIFWDAKRTNYLNLSNKKLLAEAGGTLWDENGTGDLPLHEVRIFWNTCFIIFEHHCYDHWIIFMIPMPRQYDLAGGIWWGGFSIWRWKSSTPRTRWGRLSRESWRW